ncbi:aldehyde dehydrogenase EutE [Candidatus Formimonas warabiya]|uniref:Aldehyde dehydrogenase EutE n=1 Tax=Formimonas warabiya TaxID=1761012 RepID=A0A3G1L2D4_FORW1|nr:aldehyde dehydrogenase EutE [Candidatus Formimonas warabiya]
MEHLKQKNPAPTNGPGGGPGNGIFDEVNEAVEAAWLAQKHLIALGLEKRERIIEAMRQAGMANVEMLARMEVEETGMGRYEDKVLKHHLAILRTPGVEDIRPEVFSGDHGLTLVERLPFGVAGCITPSTAPSETVFHNTICMIAAGNSAVISPHPAAKNVTLKAVEILNLAVQSAGGPVNLVVCLREATLQKASEIMKHPKINLLLATGGPGVVEAVLSSGKKAIGAGPGNPPALVDETADLPKAARDIVAGAGFENDIQCIGEKEVLVVEQVADRLIAEMAKSGAYLLKDEKEVDRLTKLVTTPEGQVNKDYIGKDAQVILHAMGIPAPDHIRVIIYEVPANHITVREEFLMPLLPIVRVKDVDEGIELAVCIEGGCRHTATMHSKNVDNMTRFARAIQTTIFVKNGPSYNGVGLGGEGYGTMTIAGPTGEGLTSPRSFTRVQRCTLVEGFNLRS